MEVLKKSKSDFQVSGHLIWICCSFWRGRCSFNCESHQFKRIDLEEFEREWGISPYRVDVLALSGDLPITFLVYRG